MQLNFKVSVLYAITVIEFLFSVYLNAPGVQNNMQPPLDERNMWCFIVSSILLFC